MNRHIVIDLETLGVTPGCPILTLGAVALDETGRELESLYVRFDFDEQIRLGLRPEYGTLRWWAEGASQEARAAAFASDRRGTLTRGLSLLQRMIQLNGWQVAQATGVWGWPGSFDLAIIAAAWRAAGNTDELFDHRLSRCGRTLSALTGIKPEHHDALADARAQGKAIIAGLARWAALTAAVDIGCERAVATSLT